jgi:hypothetical protein
MATERTSDLLYGYDAIGAYLSISERQVKHLATLPEGPPTFNLGRRVCARKTALDDWLKDQEARSRVEGSAHDND